MELMVAAGTALWLGLLTSISPCPLTTNIAAVSYLGRDVSSTRRVVSSGIFYTIGRTVTYVGLAVLLLIGLMSASPLSMALQSWIGWLVGPLLAVAGVMLLVEIPVGLPGLGRWGERLAGRAAAAGAWGAAAMGTIFALTFCPVSAALFFGSLIPLSIEARSYLLLPALYGVGTAAPVVAFAVVVGCGAHTLGRVLNRVVAIERWARRITALALIAVGIYMTLRYTLGLIGY